MSNENVYSGRIAALRALMARDGISAVIIPQADPHLGEYLASHWQVRRWLSGFGGSAGDLVVTASAAALWTDSRYFIQAAQQLEGSGVELMKDGLPDTPSITAWLGNELLNGQTVGVDGLLFPDTQFCQLAAELAAKGLNVNGHYDVVDELWADRPALPDSKIFVHDEKYAGESARSKIAKIMDEARAAGADAVLVSALDEIAWTLNIRCDDVRHTPVATAFLYLRDKDSILFIEDSKLTDQTRVYLASQGVVCQPYGKMMDYIKSLPEAEKVMVDKNKTSWAINDILGNRAIDSGISTAARLKSVKNDTQIACLRRAMVRDGVAIVKAMMEIEHRMAENIHTTELDVVDIFHKYRAQGELYKDESFGTIAGYGPHGAIVHYEPTAESNATLRSEGLLLIDSGAQYVDGTTDITRTICLGQPTAHEKHDFTLVLKGHITLAQAVFPAGTRGAQLDVLARQFLWQHGLNYLHGTGHGVGFFLSVHEGPHSIRLNNVEAPLLPGSITSNEPGVYIENDHGIRCENLVLCRKERDSEFGDFLSFETLTLCPFDRKLVDTTLLSDSDLRWLNNYHAMVAERLLPALDTEEQRQWLIRQTAPITR